MFKIDDFANILALAGNETKNSISIPFLFYVTCWGTDLLFILLRIKIYFVKSEKKRCNITDLSFASKYDGRKMSLISLMCDPETDYL